MFSLIKGTLWGICKFLLGHFKGTTKAMISGHGGHRLYCLHEVSGLACNPRWWCLHYGLQLRATHTSNCSVVIAQVSCKCQTVHGKKPFSPVLWLVLIVNIETASCMPVRVGLHSNHDFHIKWQLNASLALAFRRAYGKCNVQSGKKVQEVLW